MTDKKMTEAAKAYARTETRLAVAGEVVRLFEELEKDKTINQSRLAERLGVSRAHVSKLLSGSGNWTLDTIADLLAGMDARLTRVEAKPLARIARVNARHGWLEPDVVGQALPASFWHFQGIPELSVTVAPGPRITLQQVAP